MKDHLIETHALTKVFGYLPALRKLDLAVPRGACVALLGPNGSGKSTLLRLLTGLSRPTSGRAIIGGWELPREADAVRAVLGVISHQPLLYGTLTAQENLRYFARMYHLPDPEARIKTLLERVGLAKRAHSLARTFSRGMMQRLSIARALLHDPDVLLLDEPHTGLDRAGSVMLDEILREAHTHGKTILLATHELERAARLASRVVVLARGSLVHDGAWDGDGEALAALYARVTG